jgi:hypothetical protein
MPIKKYSSLFGIAKIALFLLLCFPAYRANAQVVWQDPTAEIYHFLSRQASKGTIEFDDLIKPVPRKEIALKLTELKEKESQLSSTERSELNFYLQEFSEFKGIAKDTLLIAKRDESSRWRTLSVQEKGFLLNAEPVFNAGIRRGQNTSVSERGNGLAFWGHAGRNISFQAYFEDVTESGTGIDSIRKFSAREGIIRTVTLNKNTINYSRFKGNLTYAWGNGSLSIGNSQILWGYGENSRMVLSEKVPAYPNIRLDYRPLKWLQFNYTHGWLHSGLIDSARTYPKGNTVYGTDRELYIQKFFASHSLNFYPIKGLSFSLGESMVYSDRLKFAYLLPIMFFKAYDQHDSKYNVPTGSNGQFFLQASSRNHLPKTHLHATLFIDEIRMSKIFNKAESRNQIGFNLGASITDVLVPYLTLGMEYTRLNPFVYQNLIPAQNYSSHKYSLGDWIGQNADRFTYWVKYNPAPRLSMKIQLEQLRKGQDGTLNDQYFAEPQPSFLSTGHESQKQILLEARYQLLNQLSIRGSYYKQSGMIRPALQKDVAPEEFRLGIAYGL